MRFRNRKLKGSLAKRTADAERKRRQRWRQRTGDTDDLGLRHEVIGWVMRHNLAEVKLLFAALAASSDVQLDCATNCLRYVPKNSARQPAGTLTSPRKLLAALKRQQRD